MHGLASVLGRGLVILTLASLAACDTIDQSNLGSPVVANQAVRLAPGDKVRVTVFEEDRLSGEFEVDAVGNLTVPLAGTVPAKGRTTDDVARSIAAGLRGQFLTSPKVTVTSVSLRPFYILGEVTRPGEYPFRTGLNVLSAIAVAGGPTYRASKAKVQIQRAGTEDFKDFPMDPSVMIAPGDLIKVPERYF